MNMFTKPVEYTLKDLEATKNIDNDMHDFESMPDIEEGENYSGSYGDDFTHKNNDLIQEVIKGSKELLDDDGDFDNVSVEEQINFPDLQNKDRFRLKDNFIKDTNEDLLNQYQTGIDANINSIQSDINSYYLSTVELDNSFKEHSQFLEVAQDYQNAFQGYDGLLKEINNDYNVIDTSQIKDDLGHYDDLEHNINNKSNSEKNVEDLYKDMLLQDSEVLDAFWEGLIVFYERDKDNKVDNDDGQIQHHMSDNTAVQENVDEQSEQEVDKDQLKLLFRNLPFNSIRGLLQMGLKATNKKLRSRDQEMDVKLLDLLSIDSNQEYVGIIKDKLADKDKLAEINNYKNDTIQIVLGEIISAVKSNIEEIKTDKMKLQEQIQKNSNKLEEYEIAQKEFDNYQTLQQSMREIELEKVSKEQEIEKYNTNISDYNTGVDKFNLVLEGFDSFKSRVDEHNKKVGQYNTINDEWREVLSQLGNYSQNLYTKEFHQYITSDFSNLQQAYNEFYNSTNNIISDGLINKVNSGDIESIQQFIGLIQGFEKDMKQLVDENSKTLKEGYQVRSNNLQELNSQMSGLVTQKYNLEKQLRNSDISNDIVLKQNSINVEKVEQLNSDIDNIQLHKDLQTNNTTDVNNQLTQLNNEMLKFNRQHSDQIKYNEVVIKALKDSDINISNITLNQVIEFMQGNQDLQGKLGSEQVKRFYYRELDGSKIDLNLRRENIFDKWDGNDIQSYSIDSNENASFQSNMNDTSELFNQKSLDMDLSLSTNEINDSSDEDSFGDSQVLEYGELSNDLLEEELESQLNTAADLYNDHEDSVNEFLENQQNGNEVDQNNIERDNETTLEEDEAQDDQVTDKAHDDQGKALDSDQKVQEVKDNLYVNREGQSSSYNTSKFNQKSNLDYRGSLKQTFKDLINDSSMDDSDEDITVSGELNNFYAFGSNFIQDNKVQTDEAGDHHDSKALDITDSSDKEGNDKDDSDKGEIESFEDFAAGFQNDDQNDDQNELDDELSFEDENKKEIKEYGDNANNDNIQDLFDDLTEGYDKDDISSKQDKNEIDASNTLENKDDQIYEVKSNSVYIDSNQIDKDKIEGNNLYNKNAGGQKLKDLLDKFASQEIKSNTNNMDNEIPSNETVLEKELKKGLEQVGKDDNYQLYNRGRYEISELDISVDEEDSGNKGIEGSCSREDLLRDAIKQAVKDDDLELEAFDFIGTGAEDGIDKIKDDSDKEKVVDFEDGQTEELDGKHDSFWGDVNDKTLEEADDVKVDDFFTKKDDQLVYDFKPLNFNQKVQEVKNIDNVDEYKDDTDKSMNKDEEIDLREIKWLNEPEEEIDLSELDWLNEPEEEVDNTNIDKADKKEEKIEEDNLDNKNVGTMDVKGLLQRVIKLQENGFNADNLGKDDSKLNENNIEENIERGLDNSYNAISTGMVSNGLKLDDKLFNTKLDDELSTVKSDEQLITKSKDDTGEDTLRKDISKDKSKKVTSKDKSEEVISKKKSIVGEDTTQDKIQVKSKVVKDEKSKKIMHSNEKSTKIINRSSSVNNYENTINNTIKPVLTSDKFTSGDTNQYYYINVPSMQDMLLDLGGILSNIDLKVLFKQFNASVVDRNVERNVNLRKTDSNINFKFYDKMYQGMKLFSDIKYISTYASDFKSYKCNIVFDDSERKEMVYRPVLVNA
ncbi:MAG: hypothetical protein AAFO15_00415 [Pseudomonadota bacterium]